MDSTTLTTTTTTTTTPPPPSRHKSASRLPQLTESPNKTQQIHQLNLEIVPCSPSPIPSKPTSATATPMRELLLLSSPSSMRKSRTRLAERLELLADPVVDPVGSKKRYKTRGISSVQMNLLGCASPKNNNRRQRRRVEMEKEEKELGYVAEEVVKVRKRRQAGGTTRSKKEKISADATSNQSLPRTNECDGSSSLDQIGLLITDLIMWSDVAKSSLWFGFGSICFLSSCFTKGIGFSVFSAISQLGLLFLALSFLSNSISHRASDQTQRKFKLTEEDILRASRLILPVTNLVLSNMGRLFSGEPSMTLKVAPFLLVGAEYGQLITFRRLFALGFFVGFTAPKLYSNYSVQINKKADYLRSWVIEAWGACSHKKMVAASVVTAFWNLSSIRTRFLTAFMCLVILRYYRQGNMVVRNVVTEVEEIIEQEEEHQEKQALVVVE